MSLLGVFTTICGKIVESKIENYAKEFADLQYSDKKLKETVYAHLLRKYSNEAYYNDLDSYITTNNVIDLLIKSIRGESSIQPRTKRQFKRNNAKKFLQYNPKYKHDTVVASRIPEIFSELYDIVYTSLLALNPHSDFGKLQRTMQIMGENLENWPQGIESKIDNVQEDVAIIKSIVASQGIANITTESIGKCSEDVAHFTQKIKEIEAEFQTKHRYNEALSRYFTLLQNIANAGYSQNQANELICTLNCNIALCQSNLGFSEKAFESLATIPTETASRSKVYHLVYAMVYIQQNDIENYEVALSHADAALAIDSGYHHAFTIKQFLSVHLHPENAQIILQELESYYSNILSEGNDHSNIAEYYQFHGMINMHIDNYSAAIDDFRLAETFGYDPMITKLNIAATMYGEATASMAKNRRLLAPPVNQCIMMKVVDILKEVIDSLKGNADFDDVRKRAIALYVSACSILGKKHDLVPVEDYIYEGQEYESLRAILLGSSEALTDAQLSLLNPDDRLFCNVRNMMASNDAKSCKAYIISLLDKEPQRITTPVYHILLQLCLITEESTDYWKYRETASNYGISGDLLDSMDACAYELDGDTSRAKSFFQRIAVSSVDDNILENTLKFYLRNNCTEELRALFLRMHGLIISNSMYTADAEPFYREATKFFISQRDSIIEKILSELPNQLVSTKCKLQLYAAYYSATFNSGELLRCLNDLSCAAGEFANAFNTALCATRLFKYDDALRICYALEDRTSRTDEKVKLFWLISDILLLQNNLDGSYLWAKKAHESTSTNPYDQSHQAFFSRAFRCNHQEALKDIVEYKEEHPVVVNWLQKFSVSPEKDDVVSCIMNAIDEFNPAHKIYEDREKEIIKLYNQGLVPINMLLKWYGGDLWHLFTFASNHKLKLALGHQGLLMTECEKIGQSIVVDALSLVIIAHHSCLAVFNRFKRVYVNYGSIATVQQFFLCYGFTYLSEILTWFQTASNIIFEADGFIDDEDTITKIFSRDFIACCNIASTHKVPYLYCDLTARNFQRIPELGIAPDIEFVSIPAICYKSFALNQEQLNDTLYSLLKDSTFINFNATTILHQIRKQNYNVSTELMAPFMFCTSSCDMHSFAVVYLSAIEVLRNEQYDAVIALASIVLNDTFRIWKRGTYYRQLVESFSVLESQRKANAISKYVLEILEGIEQIFGQLPDELVPIFKTLSDNVGYITR